MKIRELKQKSDKDISKVELLCSILKFFDENYQNLITRNFETNRNLWLSYSNILGRRVRVKEDGGDIEGFVKDIDNNGYLILKTSKDIKKILSGDIEYL